MRKLVGFIFLGLATAAGGQEATIYKNAQVWTRDGFRAGQLAVRDGRFVPAGDVAGATVVDLGGRFVVPPYANAHAHLTYPTEKSSWSFLKEGVFYVWNPNTITLGDETRAFFARPDTVDVKIAQGGITEPGGHPERLYVDYLTKVVYQGKPREWFIGNAFHYGRTPAEIRASLDELKRQKADFVKIYLLYSEEYAQRRSSADAYGQKGLNPANVPLLVREARARGLQVAAHVETRHDLMVAARAGVQVAAHVPLYWQVKTAGELAQRKLTAADAREIARAGMWLIPTYSIAKSKDLVDSKASGPAVTEAEVLAAQAENIRLLRAAKVKFLIGTDGTGQIYDEAEHLVGIGAYTARDVLPVLFGTGPRLFPERRIGCLAAGCEADFLVLARDPSSDIKALREIVRRVKAGREIEAPR